MTIEAQVYDALAARETWVATGDVLVPGHARRAITNALGRLRMRGIAESANHGRAWRIVPGAERPIDRTGKWARPIIVDPPRRRLPRGLTCEQAVFNALRKRDGTRGDLADRLKWHRVRVGNALTTLLGKGAVTRSRSHPAVWRAVPGAVVEDLRGTSIGSLRAVLRHAKRRVAAVPVVPRPVTSLEEAWGWLPRAA